MARIVVVLFLIFGFGMRANGQSSSVKTTLSNRPLTAERIAVYQAFLRFYTNGSDKVLHVADTTESLATSDIKQDADCQRSFGQFEFENSNQDSLAVHTLDSGLAVPGRIALVDSARQSQAVKQNDPSKTMQEGKSVDRAVTEAFASGLLSLSEIAFDKSHRKALMSYTFSCGKLCGNTATVMLKHVGRNWKVTKQSCGEGVS
jgi:hypothetical protein